MRRTVWSVVVTLSIVALPQLGCSDDDHPGHCGNGVIEGTEACDASELGAATCMTMGYTGGALSCTSTCTLDTSGCYSSQCGNGAAEGAEQCDGDDLDDQTCASLGHTGGDLACTGTCTFDETGCVDTCGDNHLDADYEQCDGTDFGAETCATMGNFDGGTLGCSNDCQNILTTHCCTDQCTTDGQVTCNGTVLQTCETQANGCLGLTTHDCDDDGMICDEGATPPVCATACSNNCDTLDELRCNGDILQSCNQVDRCLQWQTDTDCSTTGYCVEYTGTPMCLASGDGDSCADAELVPTMVRDSGTDFTADYTDTLTLNGNPGCDTADGPEAVFQVYLHAGESVRVAQLGNLDGVVRVLGTCDATAACLDSNDGQEDISYTATEDGYYFAVVEAFQDSPTIKSYDLLVQVYPPETACGDASDNDMDGLTDCDDPSCFGQTGCTTETHCTDGQDNDGDNATDCDDSDCDAELVCAPKWGPWEEFSAASPPDLSQCSIYYTPDATAYAHTYGCGLSALPVTPGSGTVAHTTLTLTDQDADQITLAGSWSFPFFGASYSSFWVGSNGFVTFDTMDYIQDHNAANFFELPRIAGFDCNLDPSLGGTVYVDEFSDSVVVTFEGVFSHGGSPVPVTFQIVMNENGNIEVHYDDVGISDGGFVGLSNGGGVDPAPSDTDLVVRAPTTAGQLVFSEILYNPSLANDTGAEWVELYNPTGVPFDLEGCTLEDNTASNAHTFTTLVVPAHGYVVLAQNADSAQNGGVTGAYEVGGAIALSNSGDWVTLTCGTEVIDTVTYDSGNGWPSSSDGVAIQLSSAFLDSSHNDDPAYWCYATDTFGTLGDLGTPGTGNGTCGYAVLLDEGFSSWVPTDWSVENGGDSHTWEQCDDCGAIGDSFYEDLANSDGTYAYVDDDTNDEDMSSEGLVTPSLDCTGYTHVQLAFTHMFMVFVYSEATVEVSVDGGTSYTPVQVYSSDTTNGAREVFDISGVAANQADVRVRFHYSDAGDWEVWWAIDDVQVLAW